LKWKIDDVPIFVAVVEQEGVSAAAVQLNMSKSTVSKSLSRLENALGVRLLERNSRNSRITSEGETFYRQARLIMDQVGEANGVMAGLTAVPAGKLVVALPMAFGREIVASRLPEFRAQYPQIELEIIITSRPVDIIRDQIDIAVVVGALSESELIARTLYEGELVWVASPRYANATRLGRSPKDLLAHVQICEKRYASRRFPIKVNDQKQHIDLSKCAILANDPTIVREAVINGCGISPVPSRYCDKQLQRGELVKVFEHIHFESSASSLSAVYPSRQLISRKTRVFLDFLSRICREI